MAPVTLAANIVVTSEIILGLLQVAMTTGLLFAKFSRPTARVLFSRVAIVQPFEGVPSLMFRMANERTNQIVEAQLRLVLARNELTKEGERIRRMTGLKLMRDSTTIFGLTWLAIHPIDEASPLRGATEASLADDEAEIIVSLVGHDEAFGQTIHARFSYPADEIRFGHKFVDVLSRLADGRRQIDLDVFHETVPSA
jgi:inward rectifier potassium channel